MISPINFLIWNIRGASRRDSQRYLQRLCRDNNVWLLILLDPLLDVSVLGSLKTLLHFEQAQSFINDKIWVLWCTELSIEFRELAEQLVHMQVQSIFGYSSFLSAVYAKCTRVGRRSLWHALETIRVAETASWLVGGDFNMVSSADERSGGALANDRNMEDLICAPSIVGFP